MLPQRTFNAALINSVAALGATEFTAGCTSYPPRSKHSGTSGSFLVDGMIIVPCTMKTLAGIASGYCENLLLRAADVCIKENRKLLLVPREMPFSRIHLRNMKELADCGAIIMPPVMTFYNTPATLQAQINHVVNKILRLFNLPEDMLEWRPR